MREKIQQKGFVPIVIVIAVVILAGIGTSYGIVYSRVSNIIKEAQKLSEEEKYNEAIKLLEENQNKWVIKTLGIKRQEISNAIEVNRRNFEDKSKFAQALGKIDEGKYQEAIDLLSKLSESSFYYQKAQTKIEEVKRKIVEEQLSEASSAKEKAEQKAQEEAIKRAREEMVRKSKELELLSKEDLERAMNTDNDGDGLTYRQELELGTSDFNPDSDGDSVPDKYDEHPTGGGRMIVKYLEWDYTTHWTWELNIPLDVVTFYEKVPRPTWQGSYSYYSEFIDFNDKGIERLANGLKDAIDKYGKQYGWDYYDQVMFVVRMVQQLRYASDILVGFDDYTKYPMQTLNDGTGDCEDMAILTAAILKKIGYDVKLIFLNIPDGRTHLAVGVWGHDTYPGTYFPKDNKKYFYIETTATGWDFGEFPTVWNGSTGILIDVGYQPPQKFPTPKIFPEGRACFAEGTKVLMKNRTQKNIEDIKEGEYVVSFDLEKNNFGTSKVIKVIQREDPLIIINQKLKVAPDQMIYVNNGLKSAKDIDIGDFLLDANKKMVKVYSIEQIEKRVKTYDLILEGYQNFFAEGYLVQSAPKSNELLK